MRHVTILCGLIGILATGARAQVSPGGSYLVGSSFTAFAMNSPAEPASPADPRAEPTPSSSTHEPVYGVLQDYNFQVYGGLTYFRFYELPHTTGNLYGFNVSLVYYPHAGHWGADGEFAAGFAPQQGVSTTLDMGMGGGRFRVTGPRNIQFWVHALGGGAHFTPKTIYGSESTFAFEGGGGVDLTPTHSRLSYRVQADLLGTYFFGTYQYSPKVSFGVAYRF